VNAFIRVFRLTDPIIFERPGSFGYITVFHFVRSRHEIRYVIARSFSVSINLNRKTDILALSIHFETKTPTRLFIELILLRLHRLRYHFCFLSIFNNAPSFERSTPNYTKMFRRFGINYVFVEFLENAFPFQTEFFPTNFGVLLKFVFLFHFAPVLGV